jgi:hypothetical protein
MSGLFVPQHGTTKYLSTPVGPMNNASPMTMSGAAGVIELVFGVLSVIGLFTRLSAFILSGMCAVAYFQRLLPDPQCGRAGRALFFRLPVSCSGRRRTAEHRQYARRRLSLR